MISRSVLRKGFPLVSLSFLLGLTQSPAPAQRNLAGAVQTRLTLERLNVLGSVLLIGAHPDDENTALLAYFARGRKVRAAYLSLTRGEGGQNLIGSEQGELLGLIRTQELLAARKIDGAEQYFTRAVDFGFSKSAEEAMAKWGRETVLGDIVWTIRRYRPDVIVLQSTGTPRDGHGHHQASGILGREAYHAAADKSRFPEQLRYVEPWQAKRLMWSGYAAAPQAFPGSSSRPAIEINTGDFDPILGYSYAEIAGMSRSMHRTQGMGAPERRGPARNYMVNVEGDPATDNIFDGIDTSWNRLSGGAAVARILADAARTFEPEQPEKTAPLLLKARPLIAAMKDPWATLKIRELDEAIALCTGLWLDAAAERDALIPGESFQVNLEVIDRSPFPLTLSSVTLEGIAGAPADQSAPAQLAYNEPNRRSLRVTIPAEEPYSQPFWLRKPRSGDTYVIDDPQLVGRAEPPPILRARFRIQAGSEQLDLLRPVIRRYVDRVEGETTKPLTIVPPVAVNLSETVLMFPDAKAKKVEALLNSNSAGATGELRLEAPPGWRVEPASSAFRISKAGEETTLSFTVTPPSGSARGRSHDVGARREAAR